MTTQVTVKTNSHKVLIKTHEAYVHSDGHTDTREILTTVPEHSEYSVYVWDGHSITIEELKND